MHDGVVACQQRYATPCNHILQHTNVLYQQDLKPQNVLLDASGTRAKVGDLGMSALITHGYLTHASDVGTFAWAAPELLLGARVSVAVRLAVGCYAVSSLCLYTRTFCTVLSRGPPLRP